MKEKNWKDDKNSGGKDDEWNTERLQVRNKREGWQVKWEKEAEEGWKDYDEQRREKDDKMGKRTKWWREQRRKGRKNKNVSQTEGLKIAATYSFFTSVCSTTMFRLVFFPSSLFAAAASSLPSFPLCHPLFELLHLSDSQFAVSTVPRLCLCLVRLPAFSRVLLIAAVRDVKEVFFSPHPPTTV